MKKKEGTKRNLKVILFSVIGLIAIGLTYFVHWIFIIIAAIIIWLNQKELML